MEREVVEANERCRNAEQNQQTMHAQLESAHAKLHLSERERFMLQQLQVRVHPIPQICTA